MIMLHLQKIHNYYVLRNDMAPSQWKRTNYYMKKLGIFHMIIFSLLPKTILPIFCVHSRHRHTLAISYRVYRVYGEVIFAMGYGFFGMGLGLGPGSGWDSWTVAILRLFGAAGCKLPFLVRWIQRKKHNHHLHIYLVCQYVLDQRLLSYLSR